jgi:hypothetical protein
LLPTRYGEGITVGTLKCTWFNSLLANRQEFFISLLFITPDFKRSGVFIFFNHFSKTLLSNIAPLARGAIAPYFFSPVNINK